MIQTLVAMMALVGSVDTAHAQTFGATSAAPPVRVVAFKGRPGKECDETRAREGQCIDYVDLFDFRSAWDDRKKFVPGAYRRAMWRAMGPLYAHTYEDLTYRWAQGDVQQTIAGMGYFALPQLSDAWERSRLRRK